MSDGCTTTMDSNPPMGKGAGKARLRILVVDDDHDVCEFLAAALGRFGYQVSYCTRPLKAMDAAAVFRPDLFLVDLSMPDLNGLQLCRRICADPRHSHASVLMMTGWSHPTPGTTSLQLARQAGARGLLLKPFPLETLVSRLRDLLPPRPAGSDGEAL